MDTIYPLVFPYSESPSSYISLNKILITDESDSTRYSITLDDNKKCSSLSKLITETQEPIPELINYIENPSRDPITPLLVRIPASYNKLKLNVSIKSTINFDNKSLIILKSLGENDDNDNLKFLLQEGSYESKLLEVSKLNYTDLPLDRDIEGFQRIIINDSFNKYLFSDNKVSISLWEFDWATNDYIFLFNFHIWIDECVNQNIVSSELSYPESSKESPPISKIKQFKVADFKEAFSLNIEDGPEFRRTLLKYETSLPIFKKTCGNLIDELKNLEHNLKKISFSKSKIIEFFNSLIDLQFNPLLNQFNFTTDFERKLKSIFDPFEKNLKFFIKDVCDNKLLSKIPSVLSNNINNENIGSNELLNNKKQFENNSKEYYSWLNKYLSNEKERPESKLLVKRKNFELSKFDYLNLLNMVTNNQYFNQLLENFFKFTGLNYDDRNPNLLNFKIFKDIKSSQTLLNDNYKIYLNVLLRFNSEKYQLRQLIEACQSNEELTNVISYNKLNHKIPPSEVLPINEDQEITKYNLDLVFSNETTNSIDAVPYSPINDQNSEMAGILYTLGGKGKQGWHKEWVVLNKGRLIEYSDWRKGSSPINKPIEIALASIKPINYDKRQNCFEILTSSANKHVFQAINEDERNKWTKALYNAGQLVDTSRLKGNFGAAPRNKTNKAESQDKRKLLSNLITDLSDKQPIIPGQTLDRSLSPVSITSRPPVVEKDYLSLVRSVRNSNNNICVDCGTNDSVEWVSINFLVCFCIKCSSCHRHLGSHISKIKSLKLDNFENETELLLKYINNNEVNKYLEENLKDDKKPNMNSLHDERLHFIKKKYLTKKYKSVISNVNDLLIKSIQKINIPDVLKYIICGGEINLNIQIGIPQKQSFKVISLFEYSLRKFIEIKDDTSTLESKKLFIISEMLILNGCKIDHLKSLNRDIGLTEEAIEYWRVRSLRLNGGLVSP